LKDLHINQEPDELETLTSGFELEVRGGDIPIDYNPTTAELEGIRKAEGEEVIRASEAAAARRAVWVRWHEVPDFHGSGPRDRHYVLDRLTGEIRFGDGTNGLIPPRGVGNIRLARYETGGGARGNAPTGAISQLKTTVPYIDQVINLEPALGGADAETQDALLERAPKTLRHHHRAVTVEDFEDLALLASPEVARALCVPLLDVEKNPLGYVDTESEEKTGAGAVSVIIVPRSVEPKPLPDMELIRRVQNYLVKHAIATANVSVAGPLYLSINVDMEVVLQSPEAANAVEPVLYQKLTAFLHPLTDGQQGVGWPFGERPQESDVYRLIAEVPGIDYVRALTVSIGKIEEANEGKDAVNKIMATRRFLIYSGQHKITLLFEGR
jgi:predicted phage baseplate assembly protein